MSRDILLIVEDDPGLQSQLKWYFEHYDVVLAESRPAALSAIDQYRPKVILQDLGLPPDEEGVSEGMALLEETIKQHPHAKAIVMTGHHELQNAVKAVGLGAYDFYQKPINTETLDLIVQRAFQMFDLEEENRQMAQSTKTSPLAGVIASSPAMMHVCQLIEKVAPTCATVLLLGESGTGKEVLARALHDLSPRADKAFVAINCTAIPDNLLESELFGYEKGAFTGATKQTPGKIECAHGGTLFLDEIGDMAMPLQAKMLRFLQERVIERVGGREEIPVDIRVICATHKNVETLISEGSFRQDLFYRVNEVTVNIPALRERESDVILIAKALLERANKIHGKRIKGFDRAALSALQGYPWPGNIRELENKINSAAILAETPVISAMDLGLKSESDESVSFDLKQIRERAEKKTIIEVLSLTNGNISKTAELLSVSRPTLYDLLNKYNIEAK